jgi:predicted ATPase
LKDVPFVRRDAPAGVGARPTHCGGLLPDFIEHLTVHGLFGRLTHEVDLNVRERITILTGVNGSGKTHVLKILRSMMSVDLRAAAQLPFASATVRYRSGKQLTVTRELDTDRASFLISGLTTTSSEPITARAIVHPDPLEDALPEYWERVDDELWIDTRDGEVVTTSTLLRRFPGLQSAVGSRPAPDVEFESVDSGRWLDGFKSASLPTLIETARLDVARVRSTPRRTSLRQPANSRIRQYVDRIQQQVTEARRESLAVSQRADREFAARALDKARVTVNEAQLRRLYESLAELNQDLHENGLTEESMGVTFPGGRTNPTERRILNVFLTDWEAKLRPLQPVHDKLQILRSIVGDKFQGKMLAIENGELHFIGRNQEPILVEKLSSGEQHLLALFAMLLFYAERGSLVLIDEPEISLHAAWKHAFLSDVASVAAVNDLQIVLATHSTGIINGEWDLVEELSVEDEMA